MTSLRTGMLSAVCPWLLWFVTAWPLVEPRILFPNTVQYRAEPRYKITSQLLSCTIPPGYLSNYFVRQETFGSLLASTRQMR